MTSYFDAPTPDDLESSSDVPDVQFEGAEYDQTFEADVVDETVDLVPDEDVVDSADLADLALLDQPVSATVAQGSLFSSSTGDPRVDGAVSRLADLTTSDITEHPAVLEDVHRRLYDALADLDK